MVLRLAALGAVYISAFAAAGRVWAIAPMPPPARAQVISHLTAVQAAYLTHCGGCHGIEGVSAPHSVPTLRHLAGVANSVTFDLGAPVHAGAQGRPYTPAEVTQLRERPLIGPGLRAYRAAVIHHLAARCPVPAGMRVYDK